MLLKVLVMFYIGTVHRETTICYRYILFRKTARIRNIYLYNLNNDYEQR